jgi:hypothetical protein
VKKRGLCLLLCCVGFVACSQDKPYNNTGQFWGEIDMLGKVSSKVKWQFDVQYSRQSPYEKYNLFRYNAQLTVRGWIHYFPVKNFRISQFVGLWYNFPIADVGAREYPEIRTATQFTYYTRWKKNMLANRLRPEIRIIRDRSFNYEPVFRARYQVKYQRLLTHEAYDKNSLYFIAFDEVFVNGTSNVTGNRLFDQNRVFVGLGFNCTDDIAIETGYFNQLQQHAHDANKDVNHVWQLSLIIDNISFKGAKGS